MEGNQPVGGAVSTTNSSIQPAGQQVNTAGIQEELFDLPKRNESVDFYDEQQLSATEEELQAERSVDASTQTVDVYSSTMDSPTCSAVPANTASQPRRRSKSILRPMVIDQVIINSS